MSDRSRSSQASSEPIRAAKTIALDALGLSRTIRDAREDAERFALEAALAGRRWRTIGRLGIRALDPRVLATASPTTHMIVPIALIWFVALPTVGIVVWIMLTIGDAPLTLQHTVAIVACLAVCGAALWHEGWTRRCRRRYLRKMHGRLRSRQLHDMATASNQHSQEPETPAHALR